MLSKLNKKQGLIVIIGLSLAFLFLLLSLILFNPAEKETVDLEPTYKVLHSYQTALHDVVDMGSFPESNDSFVMKMNMHLTEEYQLSVQGASITTNAKDQWNHSLSILLDDSFVKVTSLGADGLKNTNDDLSMTVSIFYTETGYSVQSSSSQLDACLHLIRDTIQNTAKTCLTSGKIVTSCTSCKALFSDVEFTTGHNFPSSNGCFNTLCKVCGVSAGDGVHQYVVMRPSKETLAQLGNCSQYSKYYYTCATCNDVSDQTYSYRYEPDIHGEFIESARTILGVTYSTLNCKYCGKEMLTISSLGYQGNFDGKPHSITVNTDKYIEYSLDNENYGIVNPTFTEPGNYVVYYKILHDTYRLSNYNTVFINDFPEVIVSGYEQSTLEQPHVVINSSLDLNGMVNDSHQIQEMKINDQPVTINENKEWSFHFEFSGLDIVPIRFYVRDIHGAETNVIYYFKYDYQSALEPDIEAETSVTETWHVNESHVLVSGTVVNPNSIETVTVDGEAIDFDTGTWSIYKDVEPNTTRIVTIVIKDKSGFTHVKKISLCYITDLPTWNIDNNAVQITYIPITINNPSAHFCNEIDYIIVNGTADNPIIMNANNLNIKTDNGWIAYHRTNEKPDSLLMRLPLGYKTPSITIDVYMTHGQHVQYKLDLIYVDEVYFAGILVTETNMLTGETKTSEIRPPV